ncbi:MAG: hypothetical protein ACKON8_04130 [Planctomycetota bacterium]
MHRVTPALVWLVLTLLVGQSVAVAGEREVAIGPDTPAREVNRYFSPSAHGPTQKFFVFADARIVVLVATVDGTSDASATIHVFPEGTSSEGVDRWINNRHSDALFPDAAEPERTIKVPDAKFRAKAGAVVGHEVGQGGDEYDRVPVEFAIEPFTDGDVVVRASRGSLDAFVRTKDLPRERAPRR